MSEQRRRRLLADARRVAVELSALSEAPAARALDAKPRIRGGGRDDMPQGSTSREDWFLNRLEDLVADGEKALRQGRKGRAAPETPQSRDYWWEQKYAGWSMTRAAEAEGVPTKDMWAFYRRKGWDDATGRRKVA